MPLKDLKKAIDAHKGTFICEGINAKSEVKVVHFKHSYIEPLPDSQINEVKAKVGHIPTVIDFYQSFASLRMYLDEKSQDSALYIGSPKEWEQFGEAFKDWLDMLDDDDMEMLPEWVEGCIALGEIPQSGNYLLLATSGANTGCIYTFDHDGFEFKEEAKDIVLFVSKMMHLDSVGLRCMASSMRFIEEGSMQQWWIKELRDNHGKVLT